MTVRVACIVGSTSSQSINRKLANGLRTLAEEQSTGDGADDRLEFVDLSIVDLPLYNYDRDGNFPPEATAFKSDVLDSDAVLIVTPEYNRSIPGALKNAIDWASRPYGDNAFAGKPVGIMGASVGAIGTACAQQHLRTILAYLDAATMGQPEAYIEYNADRFADDGTVVDASTCEFLGDWLTAYRVWIQRFADESTDR